MIKEKLRFDAAIAKSFFEDSIESIVNHITELLEEPVNAEVEAILMVGGYSESPMLQQAITETFAHLSVIIPQDAGLAVLKGAVIFGHNPDAITQRIAKYTYGTDVEVDFDSQQHPIEKQYIDQDGNVKCMDVFDVLVRKGDSLVLGTSQSEKVYSPSTEDQDEISMDIYATPDSDPEFNTDEGCKKIGSFSVPLTVYGPDGSVHVEMIFGGTEILVRCTEEMTGQVTDLHVDMPE
ncbi:hypothetical protein DPMN_111685 [Dreissena polymorpha]|uniref:Heat shock protein 70 n=2 Tax=Dreissena polymorpha TaxID=45954 RepID=A0A9D4QQ09_DREPO|nr:hypothetical protein DPMN_111685 [Dreissena polymorpha]